MSNLVGGIIVISAVALYFLFRRPRQPTRSRSSLPVRKAEKRIVPFDVPPPEPIAVSHELGSDEHFESPLTHVRVDTEASPSESSHSGPGSTTHTSTVPDQRFDTPTTHELPSAGNTMTSLESDVRQPSSGAADDTPAPSTGDAPLNSPEAPPHHSHGQGSEPSLEMLTDESDDTPAAETREAESHIVQDRNEHPGRLEDRTGGRHNHDAASATDADASIEPPTDATNAPHVPEPAHARRLGPPSQLHLAIWLESGNWVIGAALDDEHRSRPIRALADRIVMVDPTTNEQIDVRTGLELLGDHDQSLIVFALAQDRGRLSRALRMGGSLVLVPTGQPLPHRKHMTDAEPIKPSPINGYDAYEVYVDDDVTLATTGLPNTSTSIRLSGVPGFALHGSVIWPRIGNVGPTFSEPPIVVADDWTHVATLVVGEEAIGPRGWRKSLAISEDGASTNLAAHLHSFEAGWFFVRAYDEADRLIDSTQFQFIHGVRAMAVSENEEASRHVGAIRISIDHDGSVNVDGPPADAGDSLHDATRSVWTTRLMPKQEVVTFRLTRGGRTVQVDVPNEQVWWALTTSHTEIPMWRQAVVALGGPDVANALSSAQLVVLPSPTVRNGSLRLVSRRGLGHTWRFTRVNGEDHVVLWLRELGNAVPPQQPVDIDLELHMDSDGASTWGPVTIGTLTVQYECAYCDHSTLRVEDMTTHLHHGHWRELVREPDFKALQRHFPNARIPRRILKCPHAGLDNCGGYYVPNYFDGDNSLEDYFGHIQHSHPNREHSVRVVLNPDEVREEFLKGLPRLIECTHCKAHMGVPFATEMTDEGEQSMMRHLIELHRPQLWTLR